MMQTRVKTMLMLFADYGICLFLQIIGIFVLSLLQDFSWGAFVYSTLMTLVLFIFLYVRTHKAGRQVGARPSKLEGLLLVAPLAGFHLVLIAFYSAMYYHLIPLGDVVMKTVYTFPDNAPRVATDVVFLDYFTPLVRIWFSSLTGFMPDNTNPLILLITPILTLVAGFFGYIAGLKKYSFLESLDTVRKKAVDKFND